MSSTYYSLQCLPKGRNVWEYNNHLGQLCRRSTRNTLCLLEALLYFLGVCCETICSQRCKVCPKTDNETRTTEKPWVGSEYEFCVTHPLRSAWATIRIAPPFSMYGSNGDIVCSAGDITNCDALIHVHRPGTVTKARLGVVPALHSEPR